MADQITSAAAVELNQHLETKGCDCSQNLLFLTRKFQNSFNREVNAGTLPGSDIIDADGKYGQHTQDALLRVLGVGPEPCFGPGKPCTVAATPAPTPPAPPVPPPVTPPPVQPVPPVTPAPPVSPPLQPTGGVTTTKTNLTPWIVGGLALVAGGTLVYMMQQNKKAPAQLPSGPAKASPARRRLTRRRRR